MSVTLLHGDCLELMKDIPNQSIDMILCDLPYGVTANKADVKIPFEPLWQQYERIIKDNGAIVLFAQGVFYIDLVNSNRKLFRYDLVWDKQLVTGFLNAKRMPLRRHEQIAVFYKKPPKYNPQFTEGQPLHGRGTRYLNKEPVHQNTSGYRATDDSRKNSTEKYPTSIVSVQKPHSSVAKHRTEKPVELLEWLINTYTDPGEMILDNCMGCGSTGIACLNTGRNFTGIEIDQEYFNISVKSINYP